MRHPLEPFQTDPLTDSDDLRAREKLSANDRFSRALAARGHCEQLADDADLATTTAAAEVCYRRCLEELKTDRSDLVRWRCARALIEFERLSQMLTH